MPYEIEVKGLNSWSYPDSEGRLRIFKPGKRYVVEASVARAAMRARSEGPQHGVFVRRAAKATQVSEADRKASLEKSIAEQFADETEIDAEDAPTTDSEPSEPETAFDHSIPKISHAGGTRATRAAREALARE